MRKPVSDNIINILSKEILDGEFMPGAKLEEQVLADRFGVSRTPIREALRSLSSMGLVEIRNRRGFKVSEVSIDELRQMFEMTVEIEALCARLAAQRMTPIERTELEKIHEDCFQAAQAGDVNEYITQNDRFHKAIYKGTRNKYLEEWASHFRNRTSIFRNAKFRTRESLISSYESHIPIIESITNNRPLEAYSNMHTHHTYNSMSILNGEMLERYKKKISS